MSNGNKSLVGAANPCCEPVFDLACGDTSIGLYNPDGQANAFLQWVGFEPARAVKESHAIIPYIGAEGIAAGAPTSGVPADICAYGNGVEVGEPCSIEQSCFGTIKRSSDPILEGSNELPYCERTPDFTVDGTRISNDMEWHEAKLSRTIMHDALIQLAKGAGPQAVSGTPDHWGLIPLLDGTAEAAGYYGCDWLKPHVLDWAGQAMCAATAQAGITLDGTAVDDKFSTNLFNTLRSIYNGLRRTFDRMPGMNSAGVNTGDIAIVGPYELMECLAECAACFLRCGNDVTRINSFEVRRFYDELLQGGEGWGEIRFGSLTIPFIPYNPYDYATNRGVFDNGDGTYNFMMLWRGSGMNRPLRAQYNPLRPTRRKETRDGGMFHVGFDNSQDCDFMTMMHQWRWKMTNPCLQTYITNVPCSTLEACAPDFANINAAAECIP